MAITVTRNLKGQDQTLYVKIKGIAGSKTALWCKVGFFWDQESADDTKIDHELDVMELPFAPDFESTDGLWTQAYNAVKYQLEQMNCQVVADV